MREMVLNHPSLVAPGMHKAVMWLNDVIVGMTQLTHNKVAATILRMSCSSHEILCYTNVSLHDVLLKLQQSGKREEYIYFLRLTSKVPLWSDADQDTQDRFWRCQAKSLPEGVDDGPLLWCAVSHGIAVGFPSESRWDCDQITFRFDELLPNDTLSEVSEQIDNLTQSVHAQPICERHNTDLYNRISDPGLLWTLREQAFPNLTFGLDVEDHLKAVNPGHLLTIIRQLASLDVTAAEWRDHGGSQPRWKYRVTPESQSVRNNSVLIGHRFFKSQSGESKLFEWHARFGSSGRIHLRFDPSSHEIEIGYIGRHLPL